MNASAQASTAGSSFTGFTKLCKGLSVFLVLGYAIAQAFPITISFFALIPGKTIPFAWNLVTAGYLEQSIVTLIVSVLGLLLSGKVLDPVWGSREFFKFIVVVNFLTCVGTFLVAVILYYATRNEKYLYTPLSGFHGALAGFLVAVKQLMPEQEISVLFVYKLRAKWLPSLFVLVSMVLGLFVKDALSFVQFVMFGTYNSWLYLRYYQRQADLKRKGDLSEEFSFLTFFPEFMRPLVNPLCVVFEKLFCWRASGSNQGHGHVLGGTPLPGSDPTDASRRRERGARALEERLNTAKQTEAIESQPTSTHPVGSEENV